MTSDADQVRLGHALRDPSLDDRGLVALAAELANGTAALAARPGATGSAQRAEDALGYDPNHRPVYAFVGDLHPHLGELGLVFRRTWPRREAPGVTRCDSGGLIDGMGDFSAVPDAERTDALQALSSPATCAAKDWEEAFRDEIDTSYDSAASYVKEEKPDVSRWTCRRKALVERVAEADRRLWTWELRMPNPPRADDLETIVLTPALAPFAEPEEGITVPGSVRLLHAALTAHGAGLHEPSAFFDTGAREALIDGGTT